MRNKNHEDIELIENFGHVIFILSEINQRLRNKEDKLNYNKYLKLLKQTSKEWKTQLSHILSLYQVIGE